MNENWRLETRAVQGAYEPENAAPRVVPLVQSTTYRYDTCAELGKVFDLEQNTYMYTRLAGPTTGLLEQKIAALEGGVGAVATGSGMAAELLTILNLMKSGDSFLTSTAIYGGSFTLFTTTLKDLGIEAIFFEMDDSAESILAKAKPSCKAVFAETIANPLLAVADFDKLSYVAKTLDVPLIIDNTFATPVLCQPLKLGADLVIHSTSKYLDGHATCLGGAVVDGGSFNWDNGKFPGLVEPDESYHGVRYVKDFGKQAFCMKAVANVMRNLGMTPSPFNSWMTNLHMETLHLRMERHTQNAQKMAEYLAAHPQCAWVKYPGLPGDHYYDLAQKYLPKGASGVICFGVKGGRAASEKFIDSLKMVALVTHVADVRSCVLQPASTTHRQLSDEDLVACGVSPDMIRFSVGVESIEDLIEDFEQAFAKCK